MTAKNLTTLDAVKAYDVCVVGSGPAGIIVAKRLVEAGLRVILIEAGTGLVDWLTNSKIRGFADFESTGNAEYPVQQTRGCLLGGTSNFWTGRCERFHPSDLEAHPYTPANNPWPLTYEELEPYYDNADVMFRVRGGVRSHYAPPRKQPLLLPARVDVSYLRNTLGRAGVTVDDSPTATPRRGIRFFRVQAEILPSFSSRRNFALVTGATATRLIANSNKQIVGAEIRTFEGEKKVARAKAFVIAAGGIGTPRLLLSSKSEPFPNGVGNSYDRVGKGFNEHPSVNFYAQVPHTLATLYPSNKIGRTHQFYNTYRAEGLGSILPVFRQSWILPHHNMLFSWKKVPRNLRWFGNRFIKAALYMGAVIEMKVTDSNRVTLSRHKRDAFGDPLAQLECNYSEDDLLLLEKGRQLIKELYAKVGATNIYEAEITFSRHHQGTCRMGESPRTSVVDPQLRVHDCPNLYLCGAETFVTGGAMQPMMTIAALADRLGVHLVDKFTSGAYQKVAELHTA